MTAEQAGRQADLIAFFLHEDNEEAADTPGPYEQGANLIRRDSMRDLFDHFD